MAPEMFAAGRRGKAVDIYSFGCLLIELFGEKRVWEGLSTGMEIMQKVCGSYNNPPIMPQTSHLPQVYCSICDACCQLDALKRPNIDTVIEMFQNFSHW